MVSHNSIFRRLLYSQLLHVQDTLSTKKDIL